ncbi:MAG: hypothetical protein Ta2B_09110 [Termitinemataceae bacterium]|nr:MAG: hypothetical protein Ta2B_09110 [Termitinemataceae bacterium]
MKKTIKLLCCAAAFAVFFATCGDAVETADDLNKDSGTTPTTVQVYKEHGKSRFTESGKVCVALIKEGADPEYLQVGAIVDGTIKFSFPESIAEDYLFNLAEDDSFNEFDADSEEIPIFMSDLFFFRTGEDSPSGLIINGNDIYLQFHNDWSLCFTPGSAGATLVYSTTVAKVTGTHDEVTASIELKRGWGWLYTKIALAKETTITTTRPTGLKFAYEDFVE